MKRAEIFDMFYNDFFSTWKHQLIQGILFILLGVAVVIFPQLIAVMAGAFFLLIGILLISSAWALRRIQKQYQNFRTEIFNGFGIEFP